MTQRIRSGQKPSSRARRTPKRDDKPKKDPKLAVRPLDVSVVTRVVRNPLSGQECVVSGSSSTTFRQACLAKWPFKDVSAHGNWIILDDRGNDITNRPLTSCDCVAVIHVETDKQTEEASQIAEEESSMHRTARFYD
ncbi:MAG: hypothetical protein C4K49_07595 [Candidatus Thorarchaeota archaeon]|nr:MAG: hypothetical protein C4K49_07595 [Candidatus Thorarchaeota archaeon]